MSRGTWRILASALVIGALAFAAADAWAQLPYVQVDSSSAYVPLSGGTSLSLSNPDDGAITVPIGFAFSYQGQAYTHVNVGVNGVVNLAPACGTANPCANSSETCGTATSVCERTYFSTDSDGLPTTADPQLSLAPFWDDLLLGSQGGSPASIQTGIQGTAPNRAFVVEWRDIRHYQGLAGSLSRFSFQLRLDEASGSVRFHYGPYVSATDDTLWAGILGIENGDGTQGIAARPCAIGSSRCDFTAAQGLSDQVIEFLLPNQPELIGAVTPPTGAAPGATISVGLRVQNLGQQGTGSAFDVDLYLSADTTITPGTDHFLGRSSFDPISPGGVVTATVTTNVPSILAPGLYRIGAVLDAEGEVTEVVENNNTVLAPAVFLVGDDVSIAIAPLPATGPGELLDIPVVLENHGSALPQVAFRVYLSSDQAYDASDTLLGSGHASLPAVPEMTVTATASVPTMIPGHYYAIAIVDPDNQINEANETNNIAVAPAATQLRGADVVAVSVAGDPIAFRGDPYDVTAVIRNDGGSTATDFYYSFHLSDNQLVTINDPKLGEFGPISLAPGQSRTVAHTVNVPASLGNGEYVLGMIADSTSQVLEQLENNNIKRAPSTITVRDRAPDFTVAEIQLPGSGAAGELLPVGRRILNAGNAPGTVAYTVVMSEDETLSLTEDVVLGSGSRNIAAAGEDASADMVRVPSSVASGSYFFGVILDPQGTTDELHEDNNVGVSASAIAIISSQLGILSRSLPIATIALPYETVLAAAGGSGAYAWSVPEGALPNGIALEPATGRIFGSASEEGLFSFSVSVTDFTVAVTKRFEILVTSPTVGLEIVTRSTVPAFVGRPYEYPLTAFGGVPPYRWSMQGNLPDGLSFSTGGVISGVGTAADAVAANFRVEDAAGSISERPITLRVIDGDSSVRFSIDVLPDGRAGEDYGEDLRVEPSTGVSPFFFSISDGALPEGLHLEDHSIVGVPARVGVSTFAVRVSDSRGDFDVNRFVLTISEATRVAIVTTGLPGAEVGRAYADQGDAPIRIKAVSATGSGAIAFTKVSGDLPPGLLLDRSGLIAGTPLAEGIYSFAVLAMDPLGQSDIRALGIYVTAEESKESKPTEEGCACVTSGRSERGDSSHPAGSLSIWLAGLGLALGLRRRVLSRGAAHRVLSVVSWLSVLSMLTVLSAVLLWSSPSFAQSVPYFYQTTTEAYVERSGGTDLQFSSSDDSSIAVTLPFPFRYFDGQHTTVDVGTNGFVSFSGTASANGNQGMPATATPNNVIAPLWDDLTSTNVTVQVEGAEPNRVFIVQWNDSIHYGSGAGGSFDVQLWLHEGPSGRFEVRFGQTSNITGSWTASSGFENTSGTAGHAFLACTPNCGATDIAAQTGKVYRALQDAGEDVTATAISLGPVAYPGIPQPVEVTLTSFHQDPIGPFAFALHLLAPGENIEPGQSAPNSPLRTVADVTLLAYQTSVFVETVVLPVDIAPGRYRIAVVADSDGQVSEPDETNNVVMSPEFRVVARNPDFQVAGVVPSRSTARPGASIDVEVQLRNSGNLDGATSWQMFLSRNAVVSTDDLAVASGVLTLPLLTTSTVTVTVELPPTLLPGPYYVGVVMDAENAVTELSDVNNEGVAETTLMISDVAVEVATTTLPRAYVGVDYSMFLQAAGGDGGYTWSLQSGSLPPGLNLISATGEIRGNPTVAGASSFIVEVTSQGAIGTHSFTLSVDEVTGGLTIVSRELLPGLVGDAYPPAAPGQSQDQQQHIAVVGAEGPVSLELRSAAPPGLTLDADGYLHGTPIRAGVFDLEVGASDGVSTASRRIRLTIAEPGRLTLIAAILPPAAIGEEYIVQLSAVGMSLTATPTFTAEGTLPNGITLTPRGLLVGTPEKVGQWVFHVTAAGGSSPSDPRDTGSFVLVVESDAGFQIALGALPQAIVGEEYRAAIGARQGIPPFDWSILGQALPRGITSKETEVDGRTELHFSGTPEIAGFVPILVRVSDAVGRRAEMPLSLRVTDPAETVRSPIDQGCRCIHPRGPVGSSLLVPLLLLAFAGGCIFIFSKRLR